MAALKSQSPKSGKQEKPDPKKTSKLKAMILGLSKKTSSGAKKSAAARAASGSSKKAAAESGAKAKAKGNSKQQEQKTQASSKKSAGGAAKATPAVSKKAKGHAKEGSALAGHKESASRLMADPQAQAESVCREVACEGLATTAGYCRMHYIKNWKKIKRKELILKEKKLNQYIEELVAKYPDKYIEAIRQDLANDKDFAKVIHDLDLDESIDEFDMDGDSLDLIDNIKRDFEDEGESF